MYMCIYVSICIVCVVLYAGSLIVFVSVGDVNTHLQAFEKSLSGDQKKRGILASTMLVFMVRGLFSHLEYPYEQLPCHTLSADELFDPFWEAVSRFERLGLRVMGLCCDGLAAKRRFLSINSDETQPYKVINPYAMESRSIYFFPDPPHLIKTVRNAWANPKRHLWVCYFYVLLYDCTTRY